jgi:hypothetical protein
MADSPKKSEKSKSSKKSIESPPPKRRPRLDGQVVRYGNDEPGKVKK